MAKGLWQPPRLRVEGEEDQRATWLELFFDLMFVVAIAELAYNLSEHVSLGGFVSFVALFIPVWWCWLGATFYATRFDTDDLVDRLLTLLQMVFVASLAVNVHHGLSESSVGYALSYGAVRTVIIIQFLIAGYYEPAARSLSSWYAKGFSLSVILWVTSVFVPIPWRFGFWVLGMIIDFATPVTARRLVAQLPLSMSHVPERLGLFTIIVLGESAIAVVRGIAEQEWDILSVFTASLSLLIAFSIWWVYFDNLDGSPLGKIKEGRVVTFTMAWIYAHLPLAIGIAATGVGVESIILTDSGHSPASSERWLFCGSVALCLTILAFMHWVSCVMLKSQRLKALSFYRFAAAIFVLLLATFGSNLPAVFLTGLVAVVCIMQVVLDLLVSLPSKT